MWIYISVIYPVCVMRKVFSECWLVFSEVWLACRSSIPALPAGRQVREDTNRGVILYAALQFVVLLCGNLRLKSPRAFYNTQLLFPCCLFFLQPPQRHIKN